ncbi:MAG: diguanylate cyclase [Limnobacter sp.]|nr:diguanylate cyclase [Limnobacter sp.]
MAIKWKWILATFLTHVLLGAVLVAGQTFYMARKIDRSLELKLTQIQSDVLHDYSNSKARLHTLNAVSNWANGLRQAFLVDQIRVLQGDGVVLQIGSAINPDSSTRSIALPGSEFSLSVTVSDTRLSNAKKETFLLTAITVFFLALSSCLAMSALAGALSTKLMTLRDKAVALQAGQTGVRLSFRGSDELAELGTTFNAMAEAIENQFGEIRRGASELELERNRLELILSTMTTGVAYLDAFSRVLYINKALAEMIDSTWPEPDTHSLVDLLSNARPVRHQLAVMPELIRNHLYARRDSVELELESGKVLQLRFHMSSTDGSDYGILMVDDVSIQRNMRDLKEAVEKDALTRVMNRRGFDLTLAKRVSQLIAGESLGLMFIDLDGFKTVNDSLGHKAGDQVLKSTADLLMNVCRSVDCGCTMGGDEFAVIVSQAY